MNMTYGRTHLQLDFADRFDDPADYHNATTTSVDHTASGQTWTWDVDTSNSVTVPQDGVRTWGLETALDSADATLLTAAGESNGATVESADASVGNLDHTLSGAETAAFRHMGTFVDALQHVRSITGGRA